MRSVKCPLSDVYAFRVELCKWKDDTSVAFLHVIMFAQFARAMCGNLFTFKEQVQICADVPKGGCSGKKENLIDLQYIL